MHLFTGENSFELLREKTRWIGEFGKKYGQENISRADVSSATVRELLDEVSVLPFLAEKRLVVIDGIPKSAKEDIEMFMQAVHPSAVVLFTEAKPDKRSGGVKQLLATAKVHTFAPLKGAALETWVQAYAAQHSMSLDQHARRLLLEYTGDDQAMLAREIEKLALYRHGQTIGAPDVEMLCVPTDEGVVWKISDLLSSGSKADALHFAHRLLDRGGDAYGLWAILTSMLKNLTAVFAAADAGMRSQNDIAEATCIHPYAVRSLHQYSRRLSGDRIRPFVQWAAGADRALKTGGLQATDEAPQEITALIDAFILKCP